MGSIITTTLIIGAVALLLGACLAVASVIFKVETDDRVENITALLPGANCGGGGYAGCAQLATAIVNDGADIGLCAALSQENSDKIAEIMGREKSVVVEKKARILCQGNCTNTTNKYEYYGISDCAAAERVASGPASCIYGCIGLGSCEKVCAFKAITVINNLAYINMEQCRGCGVCANTCPRGIIEIIPLTNKFAVKCRNPEKGAEVKKYCSMGCIGCKICEKNCPAEAITVDGVAKIDYNKCTGCGICAEKCPVKCIVKKA